MTPTAALALLHAAHAVIEYHDARAPSSPRRLPTDVIEAVRAAVAQAEPLCDACTDAPALTGERYCAACKAHHDAPSPKPHGRDPGELAHLRAAQS